MKLPKKMKRVSLVLLRVVLGWLFFYAGFSKIMNPDWSAAGYLQNANTFPEFFASLAQPGVIEIVNLLNQWGLLLIGLALILGLFVRLASFGGIVLMILYYLPVLNFPHVEHGYIIDDHIVYIAAFFVLMTAGAGHYFGLDRYVTKLWKKNS